MRRIAFAGLALLGACVSVSVEDSTIGGGNALRAIEHARVRECPASRRQDNAQSAGFGEASGVTAEDIALTPVAGDPARAVRLRRIVVAPGGVIPWHDHAQIQGMALLVSGEMTELRNSCLDPMVYRAGDIAIEDAQTAHSWRNTGHEDAVVLVSHSVPMSAN